MAEQTQLSMDDILGGEKSTPQQSLAEPKEPAAKEPLVIPKLGDTPLPEKAEVPKSSKKAWQDREQGAKGLVRDPETGQFAPKPEAEPAKEPVKEPAKAEPAKPVAAPQQEFTEKEKAFLKAAQEERAKRQELERKIAAGEYAKTAPAATEGAPKTFWDDPEAALAKQQAEVRTAVQTMRLQTAELIARQKHTDFDEKVEVFGKIIQQTPGLYQQWMASPDPAEFAYGIGKNHLELQEAGSIEGLKAKIEKETRVKLEAELKEKAKALEKERAALPPSLSEARSTGVNKPVWGGPTSMDSILHDK